VQKFLLSDYHIRIGMTRELYQASCCHLELKLGIVSSTISADAMRTFSNFQLCNELTQRNAPLAAAQSDIYQSSMGLLLDGDPCMWILILT